MSKKLFDTKKAEEKAVLVSALTPIIKPDQAQEYMDELAFLTLTAGAVVKKTFTQRMSYPNPRTYVGQGKLDEIAEFVKLQQIDLVIFDDRCKCRYQYCFFFGLFGIK